jgi:GTPase
LSHKSGFVNIIGHPNVGKSTLINAMLGERLSIITNKPQTTRHRILAIYNDEEHQIVFSDTPGVIEDPSYLMHRSMNSFALSSFEDADILIFMTEENDNYTGDEKILQELKKIDCKKFLILNKIDISDQSRVKAKIDWWKDIVPFDEVFAISALENFGVEGLFNAVKANMPEGPEYYPKDQLSDKSERFFASEIIREQILLQFQQEIPYSCEVIVESFKHKENTRGPILVIEATIYVSRKTQKSIILGKDGVAIKKLGTEARKTLETFFAKKLFLDLHVKVRENWRDDEKMLKNFGYSH